MTLSCRIHAARDLRLEELPLPELGPHDVQMKLGAGGICGSDLHYFGHGRKFVPSLLEAQEQLAHVEIVPR